MTGQSTQTNTRRAFSGTYIAGIYCRLSNEENDDETSISITTQQQICNETILESNKKIRRSV